MFFHVRQIITERMTVLFYSKSSSLSICLSWPLVSCMNPLWASTCRWLCGHEPVRYFHVSTPVSSPPSPPPPSPPPPSPSPPSPPSCNTVLDCVTPPSTHVGCGSCTAGFCSFTTTPECRSPQPSCPLGTSATNLVQNPGFEGCTPWQWPCLPSWAVDVGTVGISQADSIVSDLVYRCRLSNNCLWLGAWGGDTGVTQTVSTTAGTTYKLSLWASNWPGDPDNYLRITVNGATLRILQVPYALAMGVYAELIVTFTAVGTSTTFSILGSDPPAGLLVDDVSLAACL